MECNKSWELVPFERLLAQPLRNGIYKSKEFHGRGVKIVNMGELFANPKLDSDIDMKKVELTDSEIASSTLISGDLIFARRSLTAEGAGKCSIAISISEPTTFESSIIRARLNLEIANPEFYYYLFNSPFGKWLLGTILRQTAVAGITGTDLGKLLVPQPPKKIQDSIVNSISKFDTKITLNRQINQTLEQMAQTLFKSWFVDFDPVIDNTLDAGNEIPESLQARADRRQKVRASQDYQPLPSDVRALFPAEFEESELGWVPKGWTEWMVNDFGNVICGKTPPKDRSDFYSNDIPFIKIPDMHGKVFVTQTSDNLSKLGSESQIKKLIPKNSICVSSIATVGLVILSSKDSHTNQQINSIVPNEVFYSHYLYFCMLEKYDLFHDLASGGSATLNMNTSNFSRIKIIKPADDVLIAFQNRSSSLLDKVLLNEYEIQTLMQLRDTLLPKLISGELRLDDLPDEVVTAANE